MKYLRVMDGVRSNAGGFEYKIDELNETTNWHPTADNPKEMGGFNFCQEDKILRWLHRGDTLYDVIIPEGAEIIEIKHNNSPKGLFRSNKIIVTNPRRLTNNMVIDLYKKSNLPEKTYYQCFITLLFRGYKDVVKYMIDDMINKDNINDALKEFNRYLRDDDTGDIKRFMYDDFNKDIDEIRDYLEKRR